MLVIRIWNYFRGYVIIRVEGLTLEKFINLAIARGIFLWDIVRLDYTTIEAKVGIKGFKKLKEVVRRVGCRTSIIHKKGYPFFIHKFKYRKMLGFGFVIACGLVIFLTSFIWSIDVVGNEKISTESILNYLEGIGVEVGTAKRKIDVHEVKKEMLTNINNLNFARIEIKGTKLLVELKESDPKIDIIDKDTPCDVVANKKAVIDKIVAKNGKALVEKGDVVSKGQVLITGYIEDERLENPMLVHAEGEVIGRTYYTEIIKEPIIKEIKEETGKEHITKEIKIGDKRLHLINGDIPFDNYIEEIESKKVVNWKDFNFPLEIIEHKYKEVNLISVTRNLDSLKTITSVKGVKNIMDNLPKEAKVLSKDVQYKVDGNILTTMIHIEVTEKIGHKNKIQ